jgi:lipopolysaccharide export system protein LptA
MEGTTMQVQMRSGIAVAVFLLLAPHAHAQEAKPATAADVTADEMEIFDAEKKTIFRGDVVAVRDKTTIKSAELVITYTPVKQPDGTSKNTIDVMKATGNVRIVTEAETITSQWANIYDREDRLEAGGNVKLVQGTSTLRGEKLNINLKDKHTVMTGGRVNGSFLPN